MCAANAKPPFHCAGPTQALARRALLGVIAGLLAGTAAAGEVSSITLRQALGAVCVEPDAAPQPMTARIPGATAVEQQPLVMRGMAVGWKRRFALQDGGEIRVERFAPRGPLLRLRIEHWTPDAGGELRPRLAGITNDTCTLQIARRMVYEPGSAQPVAMEHLNGQLEPTGERSPINPPVPAGIDGGGVRVAHIDSGVNYLVPEIGSRLARDGAGRMLGYDYWDLDARPFDADPERSDFLPQRHGTRTASVLVREAPGARLIPYRYPRSDRSRMVDLVVNAADQGVRVVSVSLDRTKPPDWQALAAVAAARPQMLFVVSAGDDERNLDAEPVDPAVRQRDNIIVVTSATPDGRLSPYANWGRTTVDLLVPGEDVEVTAFDGEPAYASGSSYAAPRVAALAARLLARHPDWRAPQLRQAIFARAQPSAGDAERVAVGFLPRPYEAEQRPPR